MKDYVKIAQEVLEIEAKELMEAAKFIGPEMEEAVNTVANIKGKLVVTGVGKSGLVGAKIAATLASTGTSSFFPSPNRSDAWGFGDDR